MRPVSAGGDGYIRRIDAEKAGAASTLLGAGREKISDSIDHAAGIILNRKVGDFVKSGEQIAMFYTNDEGRLKDAEEMFLSGVALSGEKPEPGSVIVETVST